MLERYRQILRDLLGKTSPLSDESSPAPSPHHHGFHLLNPWTKRLVLPHHHARLSPGASIPREIQDELGHQRPPYRGLFVYGAHQADPLADLSAWRQALELSLTATGTTLPTDAARGALATGIVWDTLALASLIDWQYAAPIFNQLLAQQRPSGQFLATTRSDNPETHWYHELVLLHAAGIYAAHTQDDTIRQATFRAAEFHQNETQPDHATTQPWALATMMNNPNTWPLADQLLHTVHVQHPSGVRGVSKVLLTDALAQLDEQQKEKSRKD